jgi:hypothetical protein
MNKTVKLNTLMAAAQSNLKSNVDSSSWLVKNHIVIQNFTTEDGKLETYSVFFYYKVKSEQPNCK